MPKLPIHAALGVREVWFYERGRFSLHARRGDSYVPIAASELVRRSTSRCSRSTSADNQHEAVRAYRDRLR